MNEEKINPGELVEQYRFLIGGILLGLVVASFGLLIYEKNGRTAQADDKIRMLESRISDLEKTKIVAALEPAVPQSVEQKTAEESGQVKAASTQTAPASKPTTPAKTTTSAKSKPAAITGAININAATVEQFDSLPGIGPTYAKRIVEYRETNGGFKSIDELMKVKGIGPKTFEKFKDKVTVE